MNIISQCNRVI